MTHSNKQPKSDITASVVESFKALHASCVISTEKLKEALVLCAVPVSDNQMELGYSIDESIVTDEGVRVISKATIHEASILADTP